MVFCQHCGGDRHRFRIEPLSEPRASDHGTGEKPTHRIEGHIQAVQQLIINTSTTIVTFLMIFIVGRAAMVKILVNPMSKTHASRRRRQTAREFSSDNDYLPSIFTPGRSTFTCGLWLS